MDNPEHRHTCSNEFMSYENPGSHFHTVMNTRTKAANDKQQ